MKKVILSSLIALSILLTTASCSSNDHESGIRNTNLPNPANEFINTYFPNIGFKNISKLKTPGLNGSVYDISLLNGFEIDFDINGNWIEIDGGNKAIPTALIPETIMTYVTENYADFQIVQIENERTKYDVGLSNGLKLVFTPEGDFVRIDHDGDNHNEVVIAPTALPEKAKTLISTYFPTASIRLAEKKNTQAANGTAYDVTLSNRFEIDFDSNGNWISIDGNNQEIPNELIPEKIDTYTKANYPDQFVTSIDNEKAYIKVELYKNIDLVFDLQGNFIRVD
ncbi:PepSY-like domain-containing protein [Flavobacterium gelatinilyticum]|uniref:PepSY-like domain-containing protein n=1 Tax=Flavobacterium gelatinilyticum TaxID=3003260 RepID=UPI002480BDC3|nr:PepSY-like domain-containing protein [Flavobacterium gelatinilyticum]